MEPTDRSDGGYCSARGSDPPQFESPSLQRLKGLVVDPTTVEEPQIEVNLIQRPETSGSLAPSFAFCAAPVRSHKVPGDRRKAIPPVFNRDGRRADGISDSHARRSSTDNNNPESRSRKATAQACSRNDTPQNNNTMRAPSRSSQKTARDESLDANVTPIGSVDSAITGNDHTTHRRSRKQSPKQLPSAATPRNTFGRTGGLCRPLDERQMASSPVAGAGTLANAGTMGRRDDTHQPENLDGATFHEDDSSARADSSMKSGRDESPTSYQQIQLEHQGERPLCTHTTPQTSTLRANEKTPNPLGQIRPSKVCKNRKAPKRPVSNIVPQNTPLSLTKQSSRPPSQEDMIYLLLHRMRQQEQAYRSEVADREALQRQKSEMNKELQQCQSRLDQSKTSLNKQAKEFGTQKGVIGDIKQSYLKIKFFMQELCEEKEHLREEAVSLSQQQRALKDENHEIQKRLIETQDAASTTSDALGIVRKDLETLRTNTTHIEAELQRTKISLTCEQSRVVQERAFNERLQGHIQEITRHHHQLSLSSQKNQKAVVDGIKAIQEKLGIIEADLETAKAPTDLSALDRCMEKVDGLAQKETVTASDVRSMLQSLGDINKSIEIAHEQLSGSLKTSATAQCSSNDQLSRTISREFAALEQRDEQPEAMILLREAKAALEEKVRGSQAILSEIQNSKDSSERREGTLTASNERLVDELAKFRETALQLKQDPGQMVELQSLLVKWTSTKSSLAECRRELEDKTRQVEEHGLQMRSLSDELVMAKDEQERLIQEHQVTLSKYEQGLESASQRDGDQDQLKCGKTRNCNQCTDIDNIRETRDKLQVDLSSTENRLKEIEHNHDTAQIAIQDLNGQLHRMDALIQQAAHVPSLLHEKHTLIENLEREVSKSGKITQQMKNYRTELADKQRDSILSATRLQDAENKICHMEGLKIELEECKKGLSSAKHHQETVAMLEADLGEKSSRIEQLSAEIKQLGDMKTALEKSRGDEDRSQAKLLEIKSELEEMKSQVTRLTEVEQLAKSDKEKLRQLQARFMDAESRASTVPVLEKQVEEYVQSSKAQNIALDKALRIRSELNNAQLNISSYEAEVHRIEESLTKTSVSEQTLGILHEKIAQKDVDIAKLEGKLTHFQENPNEKGRATHVQVAATPADGDVQQHKVRKPANRDGLLVFEGSGATKNQDMASRHSSDFTGFHPERLDFLASLERRERRQPTTIPNSQPSEGPTLRNAPDNLDSFDDQSAAVPGQKIVDQRKNEYNDKTAGAKKPRPDGRSLSKNSISTDSFADDRTSQRAPPSSSSYGEPLLLEDLEKLEWEALGRPSGSTSTEMPRSGETDLLTSPTAGNIDERYTQGLQSKLPATNTIGFASRREQRELAGGEVADQSPRRFRWSEENPRTECRRPPLGPRSENARPETPNSSWKERHQPNSRAKRIHDETDMAQEDRSSRKKLARRQLSKNEAFGPSEADSYSASPSKSISGLSKARLSTTSTDISRSTIVGKNAPAPGDSRKGPKKARGGWKNKKYTERFGSTRG